MLVYIASYHLHTHKHYTLCVHYILPREQGRQVCMGINNILTVPVFEVQTKQAKKLHTIPMHCYIFPTGGDRKLAPSLP